jgi:hypothetical protein
MVDACVFPGHRSPVMHKSSVRFHPVGAGAAEIVQFGHLWSTKVRLGTKGILCQKMRLEFGATGAGVSSKLRPTH